MYQYFSILLILNVYRLKDALRDMPIPFISKNPKSEHLKIAINQGVAYTTAS